MKNSQCEIYSPWGIASDQICAGYPEEVGKGACFGDSGGPLVCENSGKAVLTGVVSGGSDFFCNFDTPGIYGRVTKDLGWIRDNMVSVFISEFFIYRITESYLAQICDKNFKLFNLMF